jgi:hypothetical protein
MMMNRQELSNYFKWLAEQIAHGNFFEGNMDVRFDPFTGPHERYDVVSAWRDSNGLVVLKNTQQDDKE